MYTVLSDVPSNKPDTTTTSASSYMFAIDSRSHKRIFPVAKPVKPRQPLAPCAQYPRDLAKGLCNCPKYHKETSRYSNSEVVRSPTDSNVNNPPVAALN